MAGIWGSNCSRFRGMVRVTERSAPIERKDRRTHQIKPMHAWPDYIRLRFDASTDKGARKITELTGLKRRDFYDEFGITGNVCSKEKIMLANGNSLAR
ncbi:hypothetical protein HZB07_06990 [Candidatus Saganbacteria bacterium]|nr:hypothetical protein [Candidatus Saganbacteria bacterium]